MSTSLAPVLILGKHDAVAPVYHSRLGSPFLLPDAIAIHQRFKEPLVAVVWFADMVKRAEMLTRQRLWGKAMERRVRALADVQITVWGDNG